MNYSGRCACGKVKVSISGKPLATRQCWCRQCQYATGGGPAHNAMFRTDDVRFEGELAANTYRADSGNTISQWFCPACGTPVYVESSARPHIRSVRIGVIDQPHDLAPRMAIWTEVAPPWAVIDPSLERHERQPPPPPAS